jgi:hypothetical protein
MDRLQLDIRKVSKTELGGMEFRISRHFVGKMAVLAEGDAMDRGDIIALHKLPLFDAEGNITN